MSNLKINGSTPESLTKSKDELLATLKPVLKSLFEQAWEKMPLLALQYYILTNKNDSTIPSKQQAVDNIKTTIELIKQGDEEIIFNTHNLFFHNRTAIKIVADYWALLKEIDYMQKHTTPQPDITTDYESFQKEFDKLPWTTHLALICTVTLNQIFHSKPIS